MDEPFLLMVAGPNGSGKTTLIQSLRKQGIDFGEYINPDDLAADQTGTYDERVTQAQSIADARRNACIDARRSFTFETVMSHPSKLEILVRAKEAGFFVQLFFVGIDDPKTNVERVALRVVQGGHNVPEDKIFSRWKRTMEQLHEAIRSADEAFVFDNSAAGIIDLTPRLVFRRSFIQKRNLPRHEQYPPIPNWVYHYVLRPLGIDSPSSYSSFGPPRVMRSVISTPGTLASRENRPEIISYRPAPHDLEIEQALLGSILLDNSAFYKVCDFMESLHFYEPIHQKIFELAAGLIQAGKLASPNTLKSFLPFDIDIAGLTIAQYLVRLTAEVTDSADAERLGRILCGLAVRRGLIIVCNDVSEIAYSAAPEFDAAELLLQAERGIFNLAEPVRYDSHGMQRFSHALVSAVDSIARAYSGEAALSGIATGFNDVDRITQGFQNSDLIIIGGDVGIGKTSLVANIAYNVAKAWRGEVSSDGRMNTVQGGIVGFFSLDMSAEQLAMSIIAGQAGIPMNLIRRGAIGESDFDRIATVARKIETIPLYIDDTGGLSIALIAARARRLKRLRGLDLLIVDSILSLNEAMPHTNKDASQKLDDIVISLKSLAKELNVPIVGISQFAAPPEKYHRPNLTELRAWRPIDNHADLVMFVLREEYYLAREEPPLGTDAHLRWLADMEAAHGKAEIIIAKHRHGPTGTVFVQFAPEVGLFSDMSKQDRFD